MIIAKLALCNGLNFLSRFTDKGGTVYNQTKDSGFIQGMSSMLEAAVTPDTEEIFVVPNEEIVRLPKIANILNFTSSNK